MLNNARAALIHLQMHCNVGSRVLARYLALHVDELLACKPDSAGGAGVVVDNKSTIRPFRIRQVTWARQGSDDGPRLEG